jgi:hypothetical protein
MAVPDRPISLRQFIVTPTDLALKRAAADLRSIGAAFALVGGMAVSARTKPRFTDDVDFAIVVPHDSQAEKIAHALLTRGYRVAIQLEDEAADRMATLRLVPPGFDDSRTAPIVDLLFATTGIEKEVVEAATPLQAAPGVTVPTARVEHLLAMKILSVKERRFQDEADIQALIEEATPEQVAAVRKLVQLIIDRGYHRNRDLHQQLSDRLKLMGREG